MNLQTIRMNGGFHTQIRTTGRELALFCVSTFNSVTSKPAHFPVIMFYRGGLSVWAGRRFFTMYIPSISGAGVAISRRLAS